MWGFRDNFGSILFKYRLQIEVQKFQGCRLGFRSLDCGGSRMVLEQEQKTNTSEEASANTKHLYVWTGRLEGRVVCVFKDGFGSGLVGQDLNIWEAFGYWNISIFRKF